MGGGTCEPPKNDKSSQSRFPKVSLVNLLVWDCFRQSWGGVLAHGGLPLGLLLVFSWFLLGFLLVLSWFSVLGSRIGSLWFPPGSPLGLLLVPSWFLGPVDLGPVFLGLVVLGHVFLGPVFLGPVFLGPVVVPAW